MQDVENGVLRMHRTISSDDVEGYASHLPPDEVQMTKEEDIVYKKGVLTHASGSTSVKLVAKVAHNSQYFMLVKHHDVSAIATLLLFMLEQRRSRR